MLQNYNEGRGQRTDSQHAIMALTSAWILLQRAWILPLLKMQKLALKTALAKSLRSTLKQ
jgi:hypothetical protein